MKQGLFVTFEGGEGAGKTTLIEEMSRVLVEQGREVVKTREPGGTKLGEAIRTILLLSQEELSPYAELSLFFASRAQHIQEVILPSLKAGKIVLCDRFNDSSIAYQGIGRGLGMKEVERFSQFISNHLKPDLTLYLDLDPEIGLKRASHVKKHDRIESESLIFHEKLRKGFLAIQREDPERFFLINAENSPETVFHEAMKYMDFVLYRT
ncbi:MAG: dTMP kinase [Chlamydiae bacterium RIFCSPHIGHO2_12_FULL_44_59]|nr:MAG: dTMP kinase [Chlamydiae bacterium RIFCSPHIGHO2_01_FULL_44_39]OGN56813.1 MAG: dTMP kinase [Chlamydiae bacterium RIFCSPHIGHO2_02_FULL_45_9]OGN59920.1 MAG: dTMP kinase [Chlamydiae bacterium RIFCSPHIGHO2_12_FULL_44_59]OGN66127.1 MAG: dTMP kinase [Chlamydiae bacterium RIFCSPLOWO2_01_FULL_44_52]OGN68662.1 MAG: dTMP kinase [Chlamydiae bacterium RIFCSPLOWO2_02_FULL_45_22]OGN69774.1 MAG: dTMP kinase [Chlamydiae bacterium RIFCSPLOWO2_12_FULL_45_20]